MKKYIFFYSIFLLSLGWSNLLQAQCDTSIISTYPPESNTGNQTGNLPPQNKNPERPNMRSTFNWMLDDPNTWMIEGALTGAYALLNSRIPNPFMQNGFPLKPVPPIISNSDFHPEDGWELIQRGFGRALDNSAARGIAGSIEIPYFILYNKFESTLRVFTMANVSGYDIANIILNFKSSEQVAITFSNNSSAAQALNQKTSIIELASPAVYPVSNYRWFYGDFKMAYDPCVCEFDSRIEVHVEFVESGDIKLYGRPELSSNPIAYLRGSNATASLNQNFLSSMDYRSGIGEVKSGVLFYKNLDTLVADYHKQMKNYNNENRDAEHLRVWSTAITMGAYVASGGQEFFTKKIKLLLLGDTALGNDKSINILEGLIFGAKVAGKYTDYYAGRLKEEAKMPGLPGVIPNAMSIKGSLINLDRSKRTEIGNPGSKNTNAMDDTDWPFYPFYNEPLGVFALFEQPQIVLHYNRKSTRIVVQSSPKSGGYQAVTDRHTIATRLNNDLKYKINPAVKPSPNTKVYFSLRMDHQVPTNATYSSHLNWDIRYRKVLPKANHVFLQTPYLPASCFEKLITAIDFSSLAIGPQDYNPVFREDFNPYPKHLTLCVMVILESEELNMDNENNRAVHLFTYPVEVIVDSSSFETFPNEFIPQGFTNYRYTKSAMFDDALKINAINLTGNNQQHAKQRTVLKNVTITNNGNSIGHEAEDDYEKLDDNIALVDRDDVTAKLFDLEDTPPPCAYDNTGLMEDRNEVENFCRNGKYKGNQLSETVIEEQKKIQQKKSVFNPNESKIYPNPTLTGNFIVETYLLEESFIVIRVFDLSGKILTTYQSTGSLKRGNHQTEFRNSDLEPGIYLVEVETNRGKKTYKLVKN